MEYKIEELLPIVGRLTDKYTSKESTSVTYETAEQLMAAVLYCIREYARCAPGELTLQGEKAQAAYAYDRGLQLVKEKVGKARKVYDGMLEEFQSYGNKACQETVAEGMPSFFLYYDAVFCPQDHLLTLDYPTSHSWQGLTGIDAIEFFLRDVELEQKFLSYLPYGYIMDVMTYFHRDYGELLMNVGQTVLFHLVGHLLINKQPRECRFTEEDFVKMSALASGIRAEELENRLRELVSRLEARAWAGDKELTLYLGENCHELAFRLCGRRPEELEGIFTMEPMR